MAADLAGVWTKFDRACEHYGTFEGLLADWIAGNGPGMRNAVEDDRWHVYRWVVRQQPDMDRFAVTAADMFHNLRAALDHLVYQLVIRAGNVPTKRNSFPCVRDAANWPADSGDRLRGLFEMDKDKTRRLQPFDPGNLDAIDHHMLVLLDTLNKHLQASAPSSGRDVDQRAEGGAYV